MKLILKNMLRVWLAVVLMVPAAFACCSSSCCSSNSCCSSSCGSSCGTSCCNSCSGNCCTSCSDCCGCSDCSTCSSCCSDCNFCNFGKTWFSQRDQGSNEYVVMALTADKRHQFDREEFYGDFAITLGWQQNFSRYRLSSYFLTKCGSITVGANAANGSAAVSDIRASDLGLSTTFTGNAWLCPKYQDFLLNFDFYFSWSNAWLEVEIPFIHTRWNAGLGSSVSSAGGDYYAFDTLESDQWEYAVDDSGTSTAVVYTGDYALSSALLGNCTFGDAPKLSAGKMINCRRTANGLSGLKLELGCDFVQSERGSVGLALYTHFPVANQPSKSNRCDLFIFEPKIGSQHAWKVGGALRGQYMLWKPQKGNDEHIDIFLDGRVAAVFSGTTTRLLGLQANNTTLFNQYLLLKKYSVSGSVATYAGLERAANMLKAVVQADPGIEGQFTVMFQYQNGGIVGGFGYNFYGRDEEKLKFKKRCCWDNTYYYVIKGDLPVRQSDGTDAGFYSAEDSNINQTGDIQGAGETWTAITASNITQNAIRFDDSLTPSCCCNNNCNGATVLCVATHPRYLSHTIFGHFGYHWYEKKLKPFVGLLGKVDFGENNTALRLWGAYVKGGIS